MSSDKLRQLEFKVGSVFTPGSPINKRDLFSGRTKQIDKILEAISQVGYHGILYGERGVGKTSLSNVLEDFLGEIAIDAYLLNTTCDYSDTYSSLWRKIFGDVTISNLKQGIGFSASQVEYTEKLINTLPGEITPDVVKRTLTFLSKEKILVITVDEFDRINDRVATTLMADTIKLLSDSGIDATILLIGVADSIDDLIHDHHSIERALVQIPMPRMSSNEVRQIVNSGLKKLGMEIDDTALDEIVGLSQGLPYITHLLSLHSVKSAIKGEKMKISVTHVDEGVKLALDQWQQSVKSAYYDAVISQQPDNIYQEVLLACALAEVDEMDFFTAASVREPLRIISGRDYNIPNFSRHLKQFSGHSRGEIIQRVGEERRPRYRFKNPMMRPFITMKGFAEKLIDKEKLREIKKAK